MRTKLASVLLAASVVVALTGAAPAEEPDPKFYVFLCLGQSNMEGFPGIEEQDKTEVERFQVLAAVDFPKLDRKKGNWSPAVAPLCRGSSGLCPADYFGRSHARFEAFIAALTAGYGRVLNWVLHRRLAVLTAVLIAVFGFLWYPLKRLRRKRRERAEKSRRP